MMYDLLAMVLAILTRVQSQYTHLELLRLEDVVAKVDELYGAKKPGEARAQGSAG